MIGINDFEQIARTRLDDARALNAQERFDGAIYMCGYAIEVALKARICRTLGWDGFPENSNDFKGYHFFHTHDFELLLPMTGIEDQIRERHFNAWNDALNWEPQLRYRKPGGTNIDDVTDMTEAAQELLTVLIP